MRAEQSFARDTDTPSHTEAERAYRRFAIAACDKIRDRFGCAQGTVSLVAEDGQADSGSGSYLAAPAT
jgi:hypothetical protein